MQKNIIILGMSMEVKLIKCIFYSYILIIIRFMWKREQRAGYCYRYSRIVTLCCGKQGSVMLNILTQDASVNRPDEARMGCRILVTYCNFHNIFFFQTRRFHHLEKKLSSIRKMSKEVVEIAICNLCLCNLEVSYLKLHIYLIENWRYFHKQLS